MAGLFKEIFTGELIKQFREAPNFLLGIPDYSGKVQGGMMLNLVEVGADPDVLINNTTYPIATTTRADGNVAIALDKYDTVNTKVTKDELHGLSYDKINSVIESHKDALIDVTASKAIHAIAPASNAATTPVLVVSGAKVVPADISRLKKAFDDQKIPAVGRRLVLCNQHAQDLLETSQAFEKQYNIDPKTGRVGTLYGFEVYQYTEMPVYDSGTKVAFGAIPPPTAKDASIAFYIKRMFKAKGDTTMFHGKAEDRPESRESVLGFQQYHVVLPKTQAAIGALVSS